MKPPLVVLYIDVPEAWVGRWDELTDADRDSLNEAARSAVRAYVERPAVSSDLPGPLRTACVRVYGAERDVSVVVLSELAEDCLRKLMRNTPPSTEGVSA